jgi:hypothetical protein
LGWAWWPCRRGAAAVLVFGPIVAVAVIKQPAGLARGWW